MSISEVPELRDVVVVVERIPRTELVHLDVADVGGLVLTASEAARIGRDLLRVSRAAAGHGRAGAGAARRAASPLGPRVR